MSDLSVHVGIGWIAQKCAILVGCRRLRHVAWHSVWLNVRIRQITVLICANLGSQVQKYFSIHKVELIGPVTTNLAQNTNEIYFVI